MALFYFLILGLPALPAERSEIFLIYPGRDLALSSPLISGCWSGRILSGEAGRHLKEFLITVLLVRSSGEQYRDNATNELRDIFHFDETKEEYFGTNIHQQLLTGPNLISSLIDAYLVQNIPILFSAG